MLYPPRRNRRERTNRNRRNRSTFKRDYDPHPRPKRNPQEDIEKLMSGYEEYSRIQKRVKREEDEEPMLSEEEARNNRRLMKRSSLQMG